MCVRIVVFFMCKVLIRILMLLNYDMFKFWMLKENLCCGLYVVKKMGMFMIKLGL